MNNPSHFRGNLSHGLLLSRDYQFEAMPLSYISNKKLEYCAEKFTETLGQLFPRLKAGPIFSALGLLSTEQMLPTTLIKHSVSLIECAIRPD